MHGAITNQGMKPVAWRVSNPFQKLSAHIPRNGEQLETEAMNVLKLVFWAALLAPVVIVPTYYLLVAFGLLPPIRLPPG
jgi:hypothetical protein